MAGDLKNFYRSKEVSGPIVYLLGMQRCNGIGMPGATLYYFARFMCILSAKDWYRKDDKFYRIDDYLMQGNVWGIPSPLGVP